MDIDWISISPQNGAAGQNPVAFQLVAENETFEDKQLTVRAVCGDKYKDLTLVLKGKTYPIGTIWNFDYTGDVQQITLPKGKYKLQCWGAQGGSVTGTYAIAGSKGGYSEGVLTLTEPTTLYVFVGGKGTDYTSSASQTSTSVVNGGWNGGGAGVRTSRYNSGDTDGRSFPRGGGGATDISTVTSAMSYSSGRTTRDSASLLARCIVAGGGAGASARYTSVTTTDTSTLTANASRGTVYDWGFEVDIVFNYPSGYDSTCSLSLKNAPTSCTWNGTTYNVTFSVRHNNGSIMVVLIARDSSGNSLQGSGITKGSISYSSCSVVCSKKETTTSTSTSSGKSSAAQQGGGTSGKGQYPGTQTSAGSGGAFGLGASQSSTNYRYCGGGGGGGWYGGGKGSSDSSTSYVNYSGGGSGFVNIAANASSRPSGYTGLQLDSGTTKDGSTSFESTSGGTETGHSGNGYARITVLSQ